MKVISKILIAIFLFSANGCENKTNEKPGSPGKDNGRVGQTIQLEIYEGIIPCADCEGIKLTLKITRDYQSYELTEEYLGKSNKPFISKGKLNTERGFESDPNATLYILNFDGPEENQKYFVRLSNLKNKIILLDKNRKIIRSKLNYELKKISDDAN